MTWTSTRITGIAGAALAIVATCLPWYRFDLFVGDAASQSGTVGIGQDLWTVSTLAAIVVVVAAVVAGLAMLLPDASLRAAGAVVALIGVGIAVYAVIRWFDMPDVLPVASGRAIGAASALGAAPFLAFAGGAALALSGLRTTWAYAASPVRAPRPSAA